jgi:hypothetical protein
MLTNTSEELGFFIIMEMMEAASTSEMSVHFYQATWHNPEDGHIHTHCCENLKSHTVTIMCSKQFLCSNHTFYRNSGNEAGSEIEIFPPRLSLFLTIL